MSKFIEVTIDEAFDTNGNKRAIVSAEGEKILINSDFISQVYEEDDWREIAFKDGSSLYVKEIYKELKANLTGYIELKPDLACDKDIKEGIYDMVIYRFFTEKQRRKTIEEMKRDGWTCVYIGTKRLAIRRYRCKMIKESFK